MTDVASAQLDAAQNAILVAATTYYLGLNTGDPAGTGANEGPDGRQAITFGASSGGSQASSNGQTWSSVAGGQTYSYFSIWTLSSGGSYLRGGSLGSSITPPASAQVVFATGAVTLTAS